MHVLTHWQQNRGGQLGLKWVTQLEWHGDTLNTTGMEWGHLGIDTEVIYIMALGHSDMLMCQTANPCEVPLVTQPR